MEVRAFKLPPLPGKKMPPVQVMKRANRLFEEEVITPSLSRDRKSAEKQNIRQSINKRPASVRSISRESGKSRESAEERNSSRDKSVERMNSNVKARVTMPSVTAKSWAIYEMKQGKLIYGKRVFKSRQMASLTKIMNMMTIIEILQQLKLAPQKIRVKVSRDASCMIGTTAQLKQNYELSLYDLYFGMMLPSGNDAAYQIAQIGGCLLWMSKNQADLKKETVYNVNGFAQFYGRQENYVAIYLAQMNRISKKIEMFNSHFANPHGLSNPDNFSCAEDLCKLCTYCMQNQIFRSVVKTQFYTTEIMQEYIPTQQPQSEQPLQQSETTCHTTAPLIERVQMRWQNTNKMLKEGWSGIKTGITPNAGPCLAASVERILNGRNFQFLVILLDSASMDHRWREVREVVDWVVEEKIYF